MTKDNWIKAFRKMFPSEKSRLGYEYKVFYPHSPDPEELEDFISQVEKDAIEKTNKRWERRLEEAKSVAVQVARSFIIDREVGIPHQNPLNEDLYVKYLNGEIDAKLSDLLEEKK